jgi:hypothetical protein
MSLREHAGVDLDPRGPGWREAVAGADFTPYQAAGGEA